MSVEPVDPAEPFVSAEDLAKFLKTPALATGDDLPLLQEVLDAAIENVEHRVGPLTGWSGTLTVRPVGDNLLVLPPGLYDVTAITDSQGRTVPLDQVDIDEEAGLITLERPSPLHVGAYTLTATRTARAEASLRQAVKIIAAQLWETQRGSTAGARRFTQPVGDDSQVPMGFAIPRRAAQLLAPFERVGGFA